MSGKVDAQEGLSILLETPRLRLRRFHRADIDRLVELDSDPEVMRHISYGVATPREHYESEIMPYWLGLYGSAPLLGYWAAELRQGGEFIGWFHLRPDWIDAGELELGYRLRRSAWGHGYATEGGRALVAHGFASVGAGKICARTLRGNRGSQRVMEKCGLAYECDFVYPEDILAGRSEDERAAVKYAVTRSSRRAPPA